MNNRKTANADTEVLAPVSVPGRGGDFQITPFMALAVALIYMLTADGEIDEHESSQLQAVVGSHHELLDIAFVYAEENSVDQFLKDCEGILVQADHGCILTNLCDCLLSDGIVDDHELKLFRQISDAFGVSEMSFKTHFTNLSLKNNKSLLGDFSPNSLTLTAGSAHLTLASCLLYMMAADGNIADEEIGQLQVVLGEFEGLQAAAMKTVRSIKMNTFLRQAAPLLTQDQKIMILSNVGDSMMSDGRIDVIEDNLFQNMLTAFSVPASVFKTNYETLKIKCIKPFDTDSIPTAFHSRVAAKKKNDNSSTFKVRRQKSKLATTSNDQESGPKPEGEWVSEVEHKQLSAVVNRTMQDNIKQATDSFSGKSDVENVQGNAVTLPVAKFSNSAHKNENLQKAQEGVAKENIQKVGSVGVKSNQQKVADAAVAANIQPVADAETTHTQNVTEFGLVSNMQSIPVDPLSEPKGGYKGPVLRNSAGDLPNDKQPNHEFLGAALAYAPALKMVDPKSVQDLQFQIDKVHSNLDKLSPAKTPKAPVSAFASLVLETRLPANNQLKQKPSSSLPQVTPAVSLPDFGKNLQPLADQQTNSVDAAPPKTAIGTNISSENISSATSNGVIALTASVASTMPISGKPEAIDSHPTMLSNLTQSIHSNDVWGKNENTPDDLISLGAVAAHAGLEPVAPAVKNPSPVFISSAKSLTVVPLATHTSGSSSASSSDQTSAVEPVLVDGSVDWRILLLMIAFFSVPTVMFGRSLLHPSQICHGTGQLERKWMEHGSDKPAVLLNEESVSLSHSIQFSPSQVWLDGQRFPLYKELNQSSHVAETTSSGVKGSFYTHGIAKTRYTFVYDQAIQELRIDSQSTGMGSLEGRVGWLEENTSFTGRCASEWF